MAVTQYLNTDASAPTLTGQVGSVIALLDAVLVNGYGTKPAAGWTKEYTGTNIAVYRNNPSAPGSTGMYLRVDDTVTTYCTIRAYKSMSDINTGTDMIPSGTPGYSNSQIFWSKSSSANATQRMWNIVADDRTFYINWAPNSDVSTNTTNSYSYMGGAGDFESFVPGNSYNYFIAGMYAGGYSDSSYGLLDLQATYACGLIGRSQELAPNKQSKFWISHMGSTYNSGNQNHQPYSAYTGLRFFYPAYIEENATQYNITGRLRGVYALAGRGSIVWNENYGKLPDDPSGPDMMQFLTYPPSGQYGSVYIRLGSW